MSHIYHLGLGNKFCELKTAKVLSPKALLDIKQQKLKLKH